MEALSDMGSIPIVSTTLTQRTGIEPVFLYSDEKTHPHNLDDKRLKVMLKPLLHYEIQQDNCLQSGNMRRYQ